MLQVVDRWWFWVIVGFVCAFSIVLAFFTWRGFRRWNAQKACREAAEAKAAEGKVEGPPAGGPRVQAAKVADIESSSKEGDTDTIHSG